MDPAPFAALHGGYGPEATLLEYLSRALLHLLALGGFAVIVLWGVDTVETVRSAVRAERDGDASEQ